jgi:hypothetical protein
MTKFVEKVVLTVAKQISSSALHPEQMDIKKINIVRQILKYANYFFLSNV